MMERLQKIIAARGLCSRRQAEKWIEEGRVRVNGNTAHLGDTADVTEDVIEVDGKRLPKAGKKLYLMLNKPRGYVTTLSDEKGRKNAAELVAGCGARVYPVGRLDMDSEGLLLFTNDGEFANLMMHPRHEVDKVYRVWVNNFTPEKLEALKEPIELDGYTIKKPKVRPVRMEPTRAILDVTIHEGRNRQVRRMCQAAGLEVARLKRIAEGALKLGELKPGQWRELEPREIELLLKD
ncbi:MAG: rRNA pseudouridine synthase [Oscillospiraceae bacterium]|nr:rRNA pseudouridine synthase [Oscillospiraceae bacterium]